MIRSGAVSTAADVQPFWHRPPRLVGKSRGRLTSTPPSPTSSRIAHWSAQYGQWVSTPAGAEVIGGHGQTPALRHLRAAAQVEGPGDEQHHGVHADVDVERGTIDPKLAVDQP